MEEGMSETQAKKEASDVLRPKYRKALIKIYKEFLETLYALKHSPLHYNVWRAMEEYEDAGKSLKRAIALSVEDHKSRLDAQLDDVDDEESETDSDSESEKEEEQ